MTIYRFDFTPGDGITMRSTTCEEHISSYKKKGGGYVKKDDLDKIFGPDIHMHSLSSDVVAFAEKVAKKMEEENKKYLKKIRKNEEQINCLHKFIETRN